MSEVVEMPGTDRLIEFQAWPKISRLQRDVIVTEKLDGTNAAIIVTDDGVVAAQSRKRLITPDDDNFGFARWVYENADELATQLGPGRHFGEWWGSGIQRGYGLPKGERRFSLFNVLRWNGEWCPSGADSFRCVEAPLCFVVPTINTYIGFALVEVAVEYLCGIGSLAAPFMNPEGVVAYHKASNTCFKVTLENDDEWKGKQS